MKKRILLVEDNETARVLMGRVLRNAGHVVFPCASAAEAMSQLLSHPRFDAMITDLRMPDMDGFELLNYVGSLPEMHQPAKTVAISGMFGLEARRRLANEVEFMAKPVDIAVLLKHIGGAGN